MLLKISFVKSQKTRVQIWLYEQTNMRIEGYIMVSFNGLDCRYIDDYHSNMLQIFYQGFDEYMNLVLDDAAEVSVKSNQRRPIGKVTSKSFLLYVA